MATSTAFAARLEGRLNELPVLPTVVGQLMVLDAEAKGYFERVLELIESDQTFAARTLSAANSAESWPASPITTIQAALARLGSAGASTLVLAAASSCVFVPTDPWEKSLWRHALQVASAARALAGHAARSISLSADEAYAAGLLHDIGRLVMLGEAPETLRRIDEADWETPEALLEVERSICGHTHAEVGAMACKKWGLPDVITTAVRRHHDPVDPAAGTVEALVATVRFADFAMFPSALPGSPGFADAPLSTIEEDLMPKLPSGFSVSAEALQQLISKSTTEVDAMCIGLGLD